MSYERWLEEIELLGIPPSSVESIELKVAYEQGWTPRQVVEYETKARLRQAKREEFEYAGIPPSTHYLIRSLPVCGVLMYVLAAGTAGFLRQLLLENISTYQGLSPKTLVGSEEAVIKVTYVQSLWFFFATIFFIFAGTMILLLSKSLRRNAHRFDAGLW